MYVAYSGWLPKDDNLPWSVHGVDISPSTRTRREEYHWVAEQILPQAKTVLDAATGYVYTWHMLPYILVAECYEVTACDVNPDTLKMPEATFVKREVGNITCLPYPSRFFDVVCCISTLEHLSYDDARMAAMELRRVAKKQILVTADDMPNLPTFFNLPVDKAPAEGTTQPAVYALDIRL